jgi:enoyl-CoA hydratase/carnithine racemase
MLTGRRYGGGEAVEAGIADATVELDAVLPAAIERARSVAHHDGPTLETIKARLYASALEVLRTPA